MRTDVLLTSYSIGTSTGLLFITCDMALAKTFSIVARVTGEIDWTKYISNFVGIISEEFSISLLIFLWNRY